MKKPDKSYANIIFCQKLKEIRRIRQLSQKDVAEKLNVPTSTYANWEQGRTQPNIRDIFNLIIALEIDANELFDVSELK